MSGVGVVLSKEFSLTYHQDFHDEGGLNHIPTKINNREHIFQRNIAFKKVQYFVI